MRHLGFSHWRVVEADSCVLRRPAAQKRLRCLPLSSEAYHRCYGSRSSHIASRDEPRHRPRVTPRAIRPRAPRARALWPDQTTRARSGTALTSAGSGPAIAGGRSSRSEGLSDFLRRAPGFLPIQPARMGIGAAAGTPYAQSAARWVGRTIFPVRTRHAASAPSPGRYGRTRSPR
jgi:hypothetical protein